MVLTIATIIKFAMALAAEAKLAALFIATRKMVPHLQTLTDMGWLQPQSPIQTDNSTSVGGYKQDHCSKMIQNDGHEAMVVKM